MAMGSAWDVIKGWERDSEEHGWRQWMEKIRKVHVCHL